MITINQKKIFKNILFFIILFYFSKPIFTDINLTNGLYTKNFTLASENLKFKIKEIKNYSYLKIITDEIGKKLNTNHIISYYQEQNLKERKQISQSIKNKTIMWLNKDQIIEDFYITIECAKIPCSFNLSLEGKNTAELDLNEQYTYYVTEENKKMNFNFKLLKPPYINKGTNFYASVWARGNQKIECELKGANSD